MKFDAATYIHNAGWNQEHITATAIQGVSEEDERIIAETTPVDQVDAALDALLRYSCARVEGTK